MKFNIEDKAKIHSTNSEMDGLLCTIVGVAAFDHVATHYIVLFGSYHEIVDQNNYPNKIKVRAIQITEHCLEKCKQLVFHVNEE